MLQLLLLGFRGRVELDLVQPPVVHQIPHLPVPRHLKTDLTTRRQSVVGVVLEVLVALPVLPHTLTVLTLVLQFLTHVSETQTAYLCQRDNTCLKDRVPALLRKYLGIAKAVPEEVGESARLEDSPEFDHIII